MSTDAATLQVRKTMCATCIYRDDSPLDLAQLEAQVADDHMEGFFKGYRACHHHKGTTVCCRGFWEAHKDEFTAPVKRERWTRSPRDIAVDHGVDVTSQDAVATVILVCNRYINIEDVDEYKAAMDRKIDICTNAVRAVREILPEREQAFIGLCTISYNFEQDEEAVEP